jgi:hypothetical protein
VTIQHLNRSPAIADEARGLHRLRCKRHGFPVGAKYLGEKFVGVRKCFTLGPVVHHQEPAAHPLFRRMHRIARDRLLDLRQQGFRVAYEQIAHVLAVLEFILQ